MLRIKMKHTAREWLLVIIFYLLIFQVPLMKAIPVLTYVDELFALLGLLLICWEGLQAGRLAITRYEARITLALAAFVCVGLLGNFIYRYQPLSAVLEDVFVCLKFFLSIVSGYYLFYSQEVYEGESVVLSHARFLATVLFLLVMADYLFGIFPSYGVRYGLRVERLFFNHPTVLSSVCTCLLIVLTVFYNRKNHIFILFSLVVLLSTLRGKAIAGAALYAVIFFFILHQRRKIRFYHILFLGAMSLLVAWDQFSYYYLELSDESARARLTQTSFQILADYFPIGTGFGTYASHVAAEQYSPVYHMYGLSGVYGLSESYSSFASDTFWPIILGQTGLLGTVAYVFVLLLYFLRLQQIRKVSNQAYAAGIFAFCYLLVSSTSESAFCNGVSIPIAMMLGAIYKLERIPQGQNGRLEKENAGIRQGKRL